MHSEKQCRLTEIWTEKIQRESDELNVEMLLRNVEMLLRDLM